MDNIEKNALNNASVAATLNALEIPEAVPVPWDSTNSDLYAIGLTAINNGLDVFVEPYSSMNTGDNVQVFWNDTITPEANIVITSMNINQRLEFILPKTLFTEGKFETFYRVQRISGAELEFATRTIQVKLTGPGGSNPDPGSTYNANLQAPQLPDSVVNNGVDAAQAAEGVDVAIPAYPNMTEYDRIDFRWGGMSVNYTVQADEVATAITIHVDDVTILAAGDGQTLLIYKVIDLAANRSDGWSLVTNVEVSTGSSLDAPIVEDAVDMVLDLAILNGQGAGVSVSATSPNFAAGDMVELVWKGYPLTGDDISWSDTQIVDTIPQLVSFTVPLEWVTAVVGGIAIVSYTLIKNDGTILQSRHTQLIVDDSEQQLLAPSVREAILGVLWADAVKATVDIAAYEGMATDDVVMLKWSGLTTEGQTLTYSDQQPVTSSLVGTTLTFVVSGETQIAPVVGGKVTIVYWVTPADGSVIKVSASLVLSVTAPEIILPAPAVPEAIDGMLVADVQEASIEIEAWPGMAVGDYLTLLWQGTHEDGVSTNYQSSIPVSQSMVDKNVEFYVPGAEQILPLDGGYVEISYQVERINYTDLLQSEVLTLQVGEKIPTLAAPVVAEASENSLEADLSYATVNIAPYDEMAVGDKVQLTWIGDISGEFKDSLPISQYTVNQTLPFRVYAENIVFNTRVQVSYLVERITGGSEISAVLTLSIAGNRTLAAPTIDEAEDGVIEVTSLKSTGVTARIPASATLQVGDVVILHWRGTTLESYRHIVTGRQAGSDLPFSIPLSVVQSDSGKSITLEYEVIRTDSTTDNSASSVYEVHT